MWSQKWRLCFGQVSLQMVNRNYQIWILIFVVVLTSCSSTKTLIPKSRKEVVDNSYGAIVSIITNTDTCNGELIAIDSIAIWVLTQEGAKQKSIEEVNVMSVYLTGNRGRRYGTFLLVTLIPSTLGAIVHSDYSSEFLTLTGTVLLFGGIATIIEMAREGQTVVFPDDSDDIKDFSKYARFPAGLPQSVNPESFESWPEKKLKVNR